jgi:nitrate reductase NapAB chaperone NapD
MRKPRKRFRPRVDQLDDRCLLSGFTPAQVANAYGIDAITFQSGSGAVIPGTGAGETIAVIEAYHDPTLAADLHVFDQAYNLPDPQLTVIDQAGTQTNSTWASEESLDVEWAHAIAPGANILVVEAQSQTLADLLSAVDTARNAPGVVAVSMSWGFNEMADEASDDGHFTTPAGHAGITFVAASGDNGLRTGVEYPAASPDVLAVGGTTLNLDAAGNYLSETAWQDSGGGYSRYEPEPNYQDSIQSTGHRSDSDVAFDANPNTGVEVYETPLTGGPGAWRTVGGTSLATPAWAALIAIVDQGRALAGNASLDGPSQTLPALYSLPATDFHAVSAPPKQSPWGGGVNPFGFLARSSTISRHHSRKSTTSTAGSLSAVRLATGLGSPNAPSLVADLVASNITIPLTMAFSRIETGSHTKRICKGSMYNRSMRIHLAIRLAPGDMHEETGGRIRASAQPRTNGT